MLDLAARPSFAEALMERITEGHMQAIEKYAATVGKYVDVIEVADDLGIQHALWMCLPKIALLDPLMTVSMPLSLTASTGFDALIHSSGLQLTSK